MTNAKRLLAIVVIFHVLLMSVGPVIMLILFLPKRLSDEMAMGGYIVALVALGYASCKLAYMIFPAEKQRREAGGVQPNVEGEVSAIDFDMLLSARDDTARLRRIATSLPEAADSALLRELATRTDAVLLRAADDPQARRAARNLLSYRLPKLVQLAHGLEHRPANEAETIRRNRLRGVIGAAMQSIDHEDRSRTRVDDIRVDTDLKIMEIDLHEYLQSTRPLA